MSSRLRWLLIFTMAMVIILSFGSCGGYKTYTLKKGIGHFSLELPPGYKVSMVELREDHGYTNVSIEGPWNEQEQTNVEIGLLIIRADSTYPDAKTTFENDLVLMTLS